MMLVAEAHTDWLEDWWHPQLGNERIATVIMYLNDVAEGGETVFPNSTTQPVRPVYTPMQTACTIPMSLERPHTLLSIDPCR